MATPPRSEYPRPQFARRDWLCLNGEWEFAFDDADRGLAEGWSAGRRPLDRRITVPFPFQAPLSGIGDRGFHDVVWYRRTVEVPAAWRDRRVLLRFGAADYEARVWVNGHLVARHVGGHTPFAADITDALAGPAAVIVVRVFDPSTDRSLPRGKQYWEVASDGIFYTRTSGLWQSVWLEPVARENHLVGFRHATVEGGRGLRLETTADHPDPRLRIEAVLAFGGREAARGAGAGTLELRPDPVRLWTPETPDLYDLTLRLLDGDRVVDEVEAYVGQRWVSVERGRVCLNGAPYYMKLVLDQGYWPGGLLAAPDDEAYRRDIAAAKAFGFNGCRKHQKVEDPRFLGWADRLGFLVWGEMANAMDFTATYAERFTREWMEAVHRDRNHPCVVAWVPLNESWGVGQALTDRRQVDHQLALYELTRTLDPDRFAVDNDGWAHAATDLLTIHDYGAGAELTDHFASVESAVAFRAGDWPMYYPGRAHAGQPILVTEYGGIGLKAGGEGWGYGALSADAAELVRRYAEATRALFASPVVQGVCYTQLTDVEQEINGLLTDDRVPKVDPALIRAVNDERPSRP